MLVFLIHFCLVIDLKIEFYKRFFALRFLLKLGSKQIGDPEVADKCPIIIEQRMLIACSNYACDIAALRSIG